MNDFVRLLVVDDDEDDLLLIEAMLKESQFLRYDVEFVDSFYKAENRLGCKAFDVCLVDYYLGDRCGIDLIDTKKNFGLNLAMIVVTGREDEKLDHEALRAGASDYLVKGEFDARLLERSIRYALQRNRMTAKLVASSRLSALGEMSASIAHEINNPLAIVKGHASTLAKMFQRGVDDRDQLLASLDSIARNTKRMANIIDSLRKFSRDGKSDPFQIVRLKEIVDEALVLCRERFIHRGVHLIEPEIPDELFVQCRHSEILQVVVNLLNNAFDAVEDLDERWVRLELAQGHDITELSVVDSGRGVASHIQERMMEPFFTTKVFGRGTGLGLSISQKIVESHQGRLFLDVDSPNTKFVVQIPHAQEQSA